MAILQGIKPQDEIEGMLAVQMVGVHNTAMDAMRLVMISDQYPDARDRNTNRANKLLKTYALQVEALKKYRAGGQQKMIVEHVHVHKGGQAIVGSVTQGEGGIKIKSEKQPHRRWVLNNGNKPLDLRTLPRCQAKAKSTGRRCGNPAMKNKRVCYLHGGKSPGAPRGNKNALKHGL
jgi:hypothetical protein